MLIMALELSPVRLRALTLSPRSTYVGVCLPIGCVRVVSLGSQGCLKVLSGENGFLWEQPHQLLLPRHWMSLNINYV